MVQKKRLDVTDFSLGISRQLARILPGPKVQKKDNHSQNSNGNGLFHFEDTGEDGRVSLSLEEIETVIAKEGSRSDANMPNTPEGTSFTLSEFVKKEYALNKVYSKSVARAHRRGDLHLHKLGFIDRPYCSGQSVEYVKKYGLNRYASFAATRPAAHIDSALDHLYRFSLALRANFGGAIGWDAVNLFLAPYLTGLSDSEIYQAAQKLIHQFNQTIGPHGGQPIFSDLNLYWEVPAHFEKVPAIGPRGQYTGKVYGDYEKEAQSFVWQIFSVYKKGDSQGSPFFWPKPNLHITDKFWATPGHSRFLNHVCEVATKTGNPYFMLDRGKTAKISECCRVSFTLSSEDLKDTKKPWRMRFSAAPYISLNLPRIAYQAKGNEKKLFELIRKRMQLVFEAHKQKGAFLKKLLDRRETGPLGLLTVKQEGEKESYLRFTKMAYLVGVLGVGDCVRAHLGQKMHESDQALKFGLKIVAFMKYLCDQESKKSRLKIILEQDPAESTCYRFARLDLSRFPKQALKIVHGDPESGSVYYTNSTHLDVDAEIDPLDRIEKEGLFHPLIEGGNITHLWLGEREPSPASVGRLIKKTFNRTQNTQVALSPEFTLCLKCRRLARGLLGSCPYCHSRKVDGITRITGYYTFTSSWGRGKKAELRDRHRNKNI
ncbi:MAG: anaerobic ribonucleoside-triphosphate reductase [Candidatus Pacebacteria bacterium]|nr:anaerobic ribonucleoside-triphosphate reductase [Candidatus Paceibacterota bacterium]